MLENTVRWVREVVYEAGLRIRSIPKMFVGWHGLEICSIPPSSHGHLYVGVLSRWSDFELLRAMAVPTQVIFAYNFSAMLGAAYVHAETGNLAI